MEYYSSFSGIDSVLSCLYDSLVYHSANGLYLDRFDAALQKYLNDTLTYKNTIEDIDSVDDNKEFRILMYVEFALINKHSDIEVWDNL